jgi:hypothetical protein
MLSLSLVGIFESTGMSLWSRLRGFNRGLLTAFAAGACLFLSSLLFQPNGADAARDERTLTL